MSRKGKKSSSKAEKRVSRKTREAVPPAAGLAVQMDQQSSLFPRVSLLPIELFFLSLLLIWTFLVACFPLRNMDIWWHLRTGQLILERGTVPYFDWFTFIDYDRPWIDLHWGFQILVTWLYRWGGVDLLILAKSFCLALTIGVAWYASGRSLSACWKALCWVLPVICLSGRSVVRPEMLSLLYLAVWMYVISRLPSHPRLIYLIPLITFLWVNSHALFVLGLVVSGLFVLDYLIRHWAQGRFGIEAPSDSLSVITLVRAGVLTVIACFLNPYFEQGVLFPLTLYEKFSVDQAFYSVRVGEFQRPLDFIRQHGLGNLFLLSQVLLAILTFCSFIPLLISRRVNPFRILLFMAFTHLALKASRNTAIFALISGMILSDNLSDWVRMAVSRRVQAKGVPAAGSSLRYFEESLLQNGSSALIFLFLMISVFSGYWHQWGGEEKVLGLGEQEAWYAHAASEFAGQPGMPDRAFVSNNGQAAVYIFHNGPERKVFFDGRLEVNSKETFQLYEQFQQQMSYNMSGWAYLLEDENGQLPAIILDSRFSRNEINGLLNNPQWQLVFADPVAAVFLDQKTADRLELPLADPTPLLYPPGMKVLKSE
ncbi:hypothetical protein [Gimesia algae]|uniref:Glycosyltransferase RgtA/B/C/D-like domain-containing protein n=1 Tax=Gimesia algae TaxID=2527971 RepID=A0A517VEK3_9PLAN|nr:hypothetical protein [Gimesia algae]QDT91438.1 hypothetical protein Pan161_30950 [Gimesia algae]